MGDFLRVGGLYQLTERERGTSKSEFCPWELSASRWRPTRGFIDVKPWQHGLVCIDILEDRTRWQGHSKKFTTGIFIVGEKFVAIGNDYIERVT